MKVRSRFSYFRDKLQVFFLGLLFGLVLGGGFFVLKLDQYVKELSFYKSLTQPKPDQNDLVTVDPKTETEKPLVKKNRKENYSPPRTDSIGNNQVLDGDSSMRVAYNGNNNDGIVIRKDELLGQKTYSAQNIDSKNPNDSVASKEIPTSVSVEFWKSPLNYHGYKFSRTKLILFGYGDQDLVSVFKMENSTFLKCLTGVYKIEPTTEFHQMERVTDESLLAKIK